MSGIETAFFGALADDAQAKTSKNGKPYLRLRVRCGDGDAAQWVSVMSFDPEAIGAVDRMTKGARIYCEGRLELNEWTGNDGTVRQGLSVMSFHTRLAAIGRQKAKRERSKDESTAGEQKPAAPASNFHSDEIPFAPEWR